MYVVCTDKNRLTKAIHTSTHNIQFFDEIIDLNYPNSIITSVMEKVSRDSRMSSK